MSPREVVRVAWGEVVLYAWAAVSPLLAIRDRRRAASSRRPTGGAR